MKFAIFTSMLLITSTALAQEHQHKHGQSPYIDIQDRPIKSLSDGQIADLRAGRGMMLALAAELNGYPGPLHVLELADQLKLTAEQRRRVEQLYAVMKAEAVPAGERLIEREAELDRLFKERPMTLERLTALRHRLEKHRVRSAPST